ncbi:MAG: hypothetical protein AB7N70_17585 [Dehalococcoidia bacterium]
MATLYRIILTKEPTLADFLPDNVRGRPKPADPDLERYWYGFSAYATETQARKKARGVPTLGTAIAALDLPEDDSRISFERSLSSKGHHTIWGDAAILLGRVQSVVSVEPDLE